MQKSFIPILLFLAMIPIVFGGIEIKTSAINTQVKSGEIVSYNLLINNTDMWNKTAIIFLLTDKLYAIEPSYFLALPSNSQTIATVNIIVPNNISAQRYYEDIFIKFSDFSETTQRISYDVRGPEFYLNLNNITVEQDIDPMQDFLLTLNIENNYFEKAKTALLQISIYDEFNNSVYYTSRQIDLLEGLNDYEVLLNIGERLTNPYLTVNVSMKWFELNIGALSKTATIKESLSGIEIANEGNKIIVTNTKGIMSQPFSHEQKINLIELLLIKSASAAYSLNSSVIIYQVPSLNPGETIILSYELDYLLPILLLILAIMSAYFFLNSTVRIKKELREIKVSHNSLSFKIVLDITNVSAKKLNHLRVKEFLPPIISEIYGFGTVQGNVKTAGKQKFVSWDIKNLKPKETVEFSYMAKTKVGFFGDLTLGNSRVELLNDEGKIMKKIRTQTLVLSINQEKHKTKEL